MRKWLIASTLCLALLASDCGEVHSPETKGALAKSECERSFGSKALNSAPGTVEDVRSLEVGPGNHPAPHAFRTAPPKELIGWCWTRIGTTYTLYAVAANFKPVPVEGLGNTAHTPKPGPAPIP